MVSLVGFVGFAGAGKDTATQALVADGWETIAFGDALKDAVAAIFGWQRSLLEGDTSESRAWRETVDVWWAEKLGIPKLTPRWILQNFGSDVMRKHFHQEIWVARVEREITLRRQSNSKVRIAIRDVRFHNELAMCQRFDGKLIRIARGDDPFWLVHGINAANGCKADESLLAEIGIHSSEWMWLGYTPHAVIKNNDNIFALHSQVIKAVE